MEILKNSIASKYYCVSPLVALQNHFAILSPILLPFCEIDITGIKRVNALSTPPQIVFSLCDMPIVISKQ